MTTPAQIAELRALNDIDDEAKTGKISHDEARAILSRFINSHFNNAGEHARASIPVDFTRDDDIRMTAYIVQMRKRDATIDALTDERDRYRVTLEAIADAPACGPGGELYYELTSDDGQTGCMYVDPLGWIGSAATTARTALTPPTEGGRA